MRIALFTDTYLPDINGVVSSIELLRKQLEKMGHEAYVVCTYPGVLKIKQEGKVICLPGIELKQLYGYVMASPIHYLFIDDLEKLEFDLIHVHTEFGVGIFAGIVAKQLHIPLVRTYHTTYEDYTHYINFIHSESVDKLAKKAVSYISKLYGDSCMRLIAPSKKTRDMLLTYGIKTPIEIIPTGVELSRFKKENTDTKTIQRLRQECNIAKEEKMLLYVGRIAPEKSIDLIIKAFVKIKEKGLKIKLVVVGGGPQLEELIELSKTLNVDDYITFVGKKPFDEVPAYYHSADAFISASTTETQGMTYIEALSSGLMVLARYDEVLDEIIVEGENGYYFEGEEELFEKIERFLSLSKEEYDQMSRNAVEKAQIYDADVFGENIYRLYEEAIHDYAFSYTVSKIRLKNDYVTLELKAGDLREEKLLVSLDTYYDLGIRKDDKISHERYDQLKQEEAEVVAYRGCLKKLANRDYTVKQMYDYLSKYPELSMASTNAIIDKLLERELLDDYKYALSKVDSFENSLTSEKRMIHQLKKDGVPVDIIEKVMVKDLDQELVKARKLAEKYQNSIRNRSLNMKKQMILKKLVRDGFSFDIASQAVNMLSFNEEEFEEKDLLRKEANKAKMRLSRKYEGTSLRNRVYHALVSKGFGADAVYAMINEMEWEDE